MIGLYRDSTPRVKFDGQPFEYRRPTMSKYGTRGGERMSRHAYDWLNPVYDYSEGRVTDAALQLGITNVHQPEQVQRILSEIRTGPATRLAQQQQAYQQQAQATARAAAEANTKQLKIIQSERSAVSKMTGEYTAMLEKEADAKAKAQEAARVSAATSAANQSRQGQTSNLQIQPASSTSKTAGTQPFKRRQLQFNPQTYGGVSSMKSGTLNI